jgi:hypothetical protein
VAGSDVLEHPMEPVGFSAFGEDFIAVAHSAGGECRLSLALPLFLSPSLTFSTSSLLCWLHPTCLAPGNAVWKYNPVTTKFDLKEVGAKAHFYDVDVLKVTPDEVLLVFIRVHGDE